METSGEFFFGDTGKGISRDFRWGTKKLCPLSRVGFEEIPTVALLPRNDDAWYQHFVMLSLGEASPRSQHAILFDKQTNRQADKQANRQAEGSINARATVRFVVSSVCRFARRLFSTNSVKRAQRHCEEGYTRRGKLLRLDQEIPTVALLPRNERH